MEIRIQVIIDGEEQPDKIDPATLSQADRLEVIVALERAKNHLDALQLRQLQALAADPDPEWLDEHQRRLALITELAVALRWSPHIAGERLEVAQATATTFGDSHAALDVGDLTYGHVRSLVELTRPLDPDTARQVQDRVLPRASQQNLAEFRRSVRRAVASLDPRGEQERHENADQGRQVTITPANDAMAIIQAYLSADDAQTVMTAVQAVADRMRVTAPPKVKRTADQWRADALVALSAAALTGRHRRGNPIAGWDGYLPRWHGRRPSIQVTVALSTLLRMDDQPGELAGHGPIPAELARRIAADPTGTWRRLVTDPLGRLVDHGRNVYKPPAELRDYVIARDRTSRFPGEHRDARRCDLDHRIRWSDGGTTDEATPQALGGRGHFAKDPAGWSVELTTDGTHRWTSPLGRHYDVTTDPNPIDRTLDHGQAV